MDKDKLPHTREETMSISIVTFEQLKYFMLHNSGQQFGLHT